MQFYFDPTTQGFYCDAIHGAGLPSSAIAISDELYAALMQGVSADRIIATDGNGAPILVDRPVATAAELETTERRWRDARIAETDYLAMPDYPLTDAQRGELYAYRQALRDWPAAGGFPTQENRPQPPAWLAQVLGATA